LPQLSKVQMALAQQHEPKYIVVIGTSAGGIRALEELVMQLDKDLDASYFVVLHLSRKGVGEMMFQRLQQHCIVPCKIPVDGEPIKKGVMYLAPPDHHMLLDKGRIVLGKGAAENRWRPSINNLFRSAAANYNSRVIGVIMTGLLDDGTAGMSTIKRAGGITVVQHPNEAEYPDMPYSVLENVEVDYVESLSGISVLLSDIIRNREPIEVDVPFDIVRETEIDNRISTRIDNLKPFEKSDFNCPDCGGGLYITQKEHPTHYRCHVGHSYTDRELSLRLAEALEATFWTALRMMEERRSLLLRLSGRDKERGYNSTAETHLSRAKELEVHIENLKQILFITTQED
jgi:two-component system, chemotaxis family, protein-glutamate methylesterase/glutaminase